MSHNKITVGGQTPDSSGGITIALDDLDNVSGTPSPGDVVSWNGSSWVYAAPGSTASTTLPNSAFTDDSAYSASGGTQSTGHRFQFRHFGCHLIGGPYSDSFWTPATTPDAAKQNTKWCMGFNLGSGLWLMHAVVNYRFAASTGRIDVAWFDSSSQLSSSVQVTGERSSSTTLVSVVDLASPTEVFLKNTYVSGTVYIPSGSQARSVSVQFIKMR